MWKRRTRRKNQFLSTTSGDDGANLPEPVTEKSNGELVHMPYEMEASGLTPELPGSSPSCPEVHRATSENPGVEIRAETSFNNDSELARRAN